MPDLVEGAFDFLPALFEAGSDIAAPAAEAVAPTAIEAAGPTAFGTATDFLGQGTFDALSAGTGVGPSAFDAAGTAIAFPDLVGPGAGVGFGTTADAALTSAATTGLATGTSAIPGANAGLDAFLNATPTTGFGTTGVTSAPTSSSQLPSNVSNANAKASVFDTGTNPITGTGPSAQPAAPNAANVSAPSGVATTPDATAVSSGQATGTASVNGAGTPNTSVSSMLDKLSPGNLASGALDAVTKNPISTALGVTGLGYNILQGQKQTANQKALQADAATATANSNKMVADGEALQTYLTSGTLPPQYMQQVDNAINDAKTRAISNAAAQGLPTDPTKNTALATTLAQIDNQRAGMISQVASQLFSSGSSLVNAGQNAAGLSADLYKALVANDTTQAANIGKAITGLAQALNGKSGTSVPGTNLTVSSNP